MYLLRASAAPMSARFKWWERIERGRERLIATDSHKARHPLLPLSTLLPYRPSSGYYEGFSTQTHRQTTELTLLLLLWSSGNKGLLPWYSVLAVMFPRIKLILQHLTVSGMTGDWLRNWKTLPVDWWCPTQLAGSQGPGWLVQFSPLTWPPSNLLTN